MREGYKMTELGEIPESWNVKSLGEMVTIESGVSPSLYEFIENGSEMFYKVSQLNDFKKYMSESPYRFNSTTRNNIPANSIAFPKRGAAIFTNKVRILSFSAMVDTNIMCLIPKGELHNEFLFYYLLDFGLSKIADTSSIPQINNKHINPLIIPLPSYLEQQKIAEILSTTDDKIDVIDQQISETQALKKGLMQRLLTKGIGHTEFKNSPLGEIPKSWDVVTVKDITKEHKQGFYTQNGYIEDGIRLVRITDLNNPKVDFSEMPMLNISDYDYENYKIEKGDFLFARSGAIGRYGIVENEEHPAVFASYLIRFRFNDDIINRFFGYFFESYLCSNQLRGITQGNANVNINAENIKSLKFPLAPFEEQNKIAKIISKVDDKIEILKEKKTQYQELKQGLMQQLLTGKKRVKIKETV